MAIKDQCLNCKHEKISGNCNIKEYLMFDGSSCQQYLNRTQTATQTLNPLLIPNITLDKVISGFMTRVYLWMMAALLTTALTAYIIASSPNAIYFIFGNKIVFWGLMIAELVLVGVISVAINKLSVQVASLLFVFYSLLTGVTISSIFVVFTQESIASTFVVTSLTFGAMSLYGALTKKDLTKIGQILIMALIGLIIASVVNIFWSNSALYWITTYAGVLVFVGLTAYDTQKLKRLAEQNIDESIMTKYSILGALTLYLDFINLFLMLLRIFGKRK